MGAGTSRGELVYFFDHFPVAFHATSPLLRAIHCSVVEWIV